MYMKLNSIFRMFQIMYKTNHLHIFWVVEFLNVYSSSSNSRFYKTNVKQSADDVCYIKNIIVLS